MNIGDTVQTINTLCPISGTVVEIYDNLIVISDDDAETDDDRLEFHIDDLEIAQWKQIPYWEYTRQLRLNPKLKLSMPQ